MNDHARSPSSTLPSLFERRFAEYQRRLSLGDSLRVVRRPWPVIALSRQAGARSGEVGAAVAERLHFTLWDNELVQAVAESVGAAEAALALLDEHPRNRVADYVEGLLMGDQYTESEYVRALLSVVHSIGTLGAAVLVGRGIEAMFPSGGAFRVRLLAEEDFRLRTIAEREGLDERHAKRRLGELERERATWLRRHMPRAAGAQPSPFELMVSVSSLGISGAADAIVAAYSSRYGQPAPASANAEPGDGAALVAP